METVIQDYFNGLCCAEVVLPYNFDVESSNWAGAGITDKASFESVLGATTGAFAITGNKIEAEILPSSVITLNLNEKNITNINYITVSSLETLNLNQNQISNFNPTLPLPSSLTGLNLTFNQMTTFNPALQLPTSLTIAVLGFNPITTAGYIASEPWANSQPTFTNNCNFDFQGTTDSITGTNFGTILLTKNTTILA